MLNAEKPKKGQKEKNKINTENKAQGMANSAPVVREGTLASLWESHSREEEIEWAKYRHGIAAEESNNRKTFKNERKDNEQTGQNINFWMQKSQKHEGMNHAYAGKYPETTKN